MLLLALGHDLLSGQQEADPETHVAAECAFRTAMGSTTCQHMGKSQLIWCVAMAIYYARSSTKHDFLAWLLEELACLISFPEPPTREDVTQSLLGGAQEFADGMGRSLVGSELLACLIAHASTDRHQELVSFVQQLVQHLPGDLDIGEACRMPTVYDSTTAAGLYSCFKALQIDVGVATKPKVADAIQRLSEAMHVVTTGWKMQLESTSLDGEYEQLVEGFYFALAFCLLGIADQSYS